VLTPTESFVENEEKQEASECDVWKKIICLSEVTIASVLRERMEKRKDIGFDGTKSGSVIFFVRFYLTSLLLQSLLHFSHLFPFLVTSWF
jgi:hypothetical protein